MRVLHADPDLVEPERVLLGVAVLESGDADRPTGVGVRQHAPRDRRRLGRRRDPSGRRLDRGPLLLLPLRPLQTFHGGSI